MKESQFLRIVKTFPDIGNLPDVVRFTTVATAAKSFFYYSTGFATGVDLADKFAGLRPDLPLNHLWNELKDWATIGL
jgi:hypothetical protein